MKQIDVHSFKKILDSEREADIACIDVRTKEEYASEHIAHVENIPLDTLSSSLDTLRTKKSIYLHCRSGGRSAQATSFLEENKMQGDVYNVIGGIMAWKEADFPTVT